LNNPLKYTDPSGEFIPFIAAAAYVAMQAVISGLEARYSETGFGGGFVMGASTAALTMAVSSVMPIPVTSILSGSANYMASAAVAGVFTYGLNSAITGQPFDWKGYGINIGVAGVMGGIAGGYQAFQDESLNVWTGKLRSMGRSRFSIINTDKPFNAYCTSSGYELRSFVEHYLNNPDGLYHRYILKGNSGENEISNGLISRINNYKLPNTDPTVIDVSRFKGKAVMELSGTVMEDYTITYQYDNSQVTQVVGLTDMNRQLVIPDGVKYLRIQYNGTSDFVTVNSPYRTQIKGWINYTNPK